MMRHDPRFVTEGPADVAVIIVTFDSADDLGTLLGSLRVEAARNRLRVVVADNDSTDDTLRVARKHEDVIVVETGGNLGYAGAINAAVRLAGDVEALLILNPDLEVLPGCVTALRDRQRTTGAGVVVPGVLDSDDNLTCSLRSEPSLLAALGDAAFGERFRWRSKALSETVYAPTMYAYAHPIDWATGAALLIGMSTAQAVGAWDERFFLYSEETDYFRRVRDAGYVAWYEPKAVVRHAQGGSGSSPALDQLLAVNRIRYARKHRTAPGAAMYHAVVILHALVRAGKRRYRGILRTVARESGWRALPHASGGGPTRTVAAEVSS
ncbi:glycosyltransferase family 2 protein [Microbacterium caowuchunii]|uniref:glycosyltransferase family 2 protein n=1 Tax=Microbacterium caowuchunii TaxID=2614638 RepID=UPI00124725E7|nr:glycosyltransferase family 2 protein [Microbacterium caowuchunii]QEW00804.1 glycosyltransferase family 2 protein [Microbacterium caowuchunii]